MTAQGDAPASFTVLDWLGTITTGAAILGLATFPIVARSFEAMFADFGGDGALPALTQLALRVWFPPALGVVPALLLLNGLRPTLALGRRRLSVVAAFLAAVALLALCLLAVYLPIFSLADNIE